jgi:hypothetical protein
LPGYLYVLFPSDQFVIEKLQKFLHDNVFGLKISMTGENGEDLSEHLKPKTFDPEDPES